MKPSSDSTTEFNPFRAGLRAARQNLLPGLVLQALALILVLGYYFWPAMNQWCRSLAQFKTEVGVPYGMVSTALFGGLIPFIYQKLNPATRGITFWSFLPFYVLFWAFRGFDIDLLYKIQSWIFGSGNEVSVIVKKVLVDQFLYNPIWAVPLQILGYHWMHQGYRLSAFKGFDWKRFVTRLVPTALVSAWGVWIPMVTIVYCLPTELQIPLNNLVLCFWVLLLTTLTAKRPPAQPAA